MAQKQKELCLSVLDQQLHIRVYARFLLVFPFYDLLHANDAIVSLRAGLSATLHRFPYLAGTIEIPDLSTQRIKASFHEPIASDVEAHRILAVSTSVASNPDFDYESLEKEGFPSSRLPSDIFCPELLKNHQGLDDDDPFAEKRTSLDKGVPIPILACQATFIPGGLILSVYMHHSLLDGSGVARLFEVWSEGVRQLAIREKDNGSSAHIGLDTPNGVLQLKEEKDTTRIDPSSCRSALDALVRPVHPSVLRLPSPIPPPSLHRKTYTVITRLFEISSSTLTNLRNDLSQLTGLRISRFVALTALLWAHIIHARRANASKSSVTSSTLAVVVDCHKHLGAPFTAPDYLGNLVLKAMSTCSSDAQPNFPDVVVAVENVALLAHEIAESIRSVDRTWVIERLSHIAASFPNSPSTTDGPHTSYTEETDLYITSWQRIGADLCWNIPGTASPKPVAIRRAAWVSEGGIVILPRREEGDEAFEVLVSLAEEDMRGFEMGMGRGGWVERVVDG